MKAIPYTTDAMKLLHEGALALAEIESNGIAVDIPYVEFALKNTEKKIAKLEAKLDTTPVMMEWRKVYRDATDLNSNEQLGHVLYEVMKFPSPGKTDRNSNQYKTDALSLRSTVDDAFTEIFIEAKQLKKSVATNLNGILREVVDGRLHCFFGLHGAVSYRSTCSDINLQNIPIRDPQIGMIVRQAFLPSPGNQLVETDFSGAEVRVGACYHHDPVMIEYLTNTNKLPDGEPEKDMHRDMAMQLYKLPYDECSKGCRQEAKNKFVFAEFYGAWYKTTTLGLWRETDQTYLKKSVNTTLRHHLDSVGLGTLGPLDPKGDPKPGTFEAHVQSVEKDFWGNRFKIYAEWKDEWYDAYVKQGWFKTHTGFICQSYMGKNDAVNYPVQGSSFHCLLWCIIELMREMKRLGMKSKIVSQVHDSIVGDIVPSEFDTYVKLCRDIMYKRLLSHYSAWMVLPMEMEIEVAPVNASWFEKKKFKH